MTYIDPLARRIQELAATNADFPDHADLLFQMYALLARAKGDGTTLRDVHDAWVIWMVSLRETHPSMIPFDELDKDTQNEDQPFVEAIHQAAREQQISR